MTSRSSARTTTGWTSSTRRCWGDRRTATTRSPPYAAIDFTTLGDASDDGQVAAAAAMASKAGATDVLVLTHGWNNDKKRAQAMFDRLSGHLPGFRSYSAGRTLAIVGVLWPSVRWADEDNIAGGGASVLGPGTALDAAISESVDDPQIAQELRQAAHHLDTSAARADFTAALRSILPVGSYRGEDPIPEALVAWDAGRGHRDAYGAIGVNGALGTSEADDSTALKETGFNYQFQPGRIYNLRADDYIPRHSRVTGKPVAYALLRAMMAGH